MESTTLDVLKVKKGAVMGINNKKNLLSRISIIFIMLLFAMCLAINVSFCSNYSSYELLDKATITETWAISESAVANGDGDNTTDFKASFLNKNNSHNEAITKNICSMFVIAAIPQGISLLLFLIVVLLFFFLTFFILLPNGWTLINQKVRLDN